MFPTVPPKDLVPSTAQASNDAQVFTMWLHGKSDASRKIYKSAIERFQEANGYKSLLSITVQDIQSHMDSLGAAAHSTKSLHLAAIKSLFSFAQKLGYLQVNPSLIVQLPRNESDLSARILTETEVHRMLRIAEDRDHVIIRLLYSTGIRVSELVGLSWKDVQERPHGGQIAVLGKGGKRRSVLLSEDTWKTLNTIRPVNFQSGEPVLVSRKKKGRLTSTQVFRIVRNIAKKAGIDGNVSPHWLRHCHASHALDRGCPIHLVQSTLGHASVSTTSKYLHARPDASSSTYLPI